MPFELRNSEDNRLINSNSLSTADYVNSENGDGGPDGSQIISFPFGTMNISEWILKDIRITYSEYEFNDYVTLDWKGDFDLVTMYFSLKGKFTLPGNGIQSAIELGSNQHNIFYGQSAQGQMRLEELSMRSFMVQITKDRFFAIANGGNEVLARFIESMSDANTVSLSEKNLDIDFPIQNCINSILKCNYEAPLKKMFLFSKVIELLVLQVESYQRLLNPQTRYIKTDYDKERIAFARDYLVKNLETPPSLTELSRIVGINEFKLKRGFREVFGQTVFGYLNDVRMELAKN